MLLELQIFLLILTALLLSDLCGKKRNSSTRNTDNNGRDGSGNKSKVLTLGEDMTIMNITWKRFSFIYLLSRLTLLMPIFPSTGYIQSFLTFYRLIRTSYLPNYEFCARISKNYGDVVIFRNPFKRQGITDRNGQTKSVRCLTQRICKYNYTFICIQVEFHLSFDLQSP